MNGAVSPVNSGLNTFNPVGWGCRMHRLHFSRNVRPSKPVSWI